MQSVTREADAATWSPPVERDEVEPISPCVLIADEDPQTLTVLTGGLRRAGFAVIAVDSGARVIDYLRKCVIFGGRLLAPDVVIASTQMFDCSGVDLLELLHHARCDIPIILVTCIDDQEPAERVRREEAVANFDRPFDTDDVAMAVLWACDSGSVRFLRSASAKRRRRSTLGHGEGLRDRDREELEQGSAGADDAEV